MFLKNLVQLLRENDNLPKKAWIVDVIGGLQIRMTQEFKFEDLKFNLDILILSLIFTSGYQNLIPDVHQLILIDDMKYKIFPACLHGLSQQGFWEDVMFKVGTLRILFEEFYEDFFTDI